MNRWGTRAVLVFLSLAFPGVAFSQTSQDVTKGFAESIAKRMNLTKVECPTSYDFFVSGGMKVYCFIHPYANFGAFNRAWSSSAEWEGVFFPDKEFIAAAQVEGTYVEGAWSSLSRALKAAGLGVAFETYSASYLMHAGNWGFDGSVIVNLLIGTSNTGERNTLDMIFNPAR